MPASVKESDDPPGRISSLKRLTAKTYGYMVCHMSSIKVTFTLDEGTVGRLGRTAERLGMPKSQVVREAIREYSSRIGRLGEEERLGLLRTFDEVVPAIPKRPAGDVEREIEGIREARRSGGRKSGGRKSGGRKSVEGA